VTHRLALPLAFCAALAASAAAGAELPSRSPPGALTASAPAAKKCQIDGRAGIMLPGSGACLLISGSISAQAAVGGGGGARPSPAP